MTLLLLLACAHDTDADTAGDDTSGDDTTGGDTTGGDAASFEAIAEAAEWADTVTVSIEDGDLVFESDGIPNHDTDDLYAVIGGTSDDCTWAATGTASIQEQDLYFRISLSPRIADAPTDTSLGGIGPAISGAVYFNAYEASYSCYARDATVTGTTYNFTDACGGHPTPDQAGGQYHYHGTPYCTVASVDVPGEHSRVIGFLSDGFPIYGPLGDGGVAPDDLDECLGHVGHVPETDEEVYHYHTSESPPYISNCYRGTPQVSGGM